MPESHAIFLSYRRSDSNDVSGRIYDRLASHFGAATIFKDVHSIPYGEDFPSYIQGQLSQCKVLLAVIGPTWLTVTKDGQRRLENPADWVRLEIQTALENEKIAVIPLLVGKTRLPAKAELPEVLTPLATLNSAQARPDPDFHQDMKRLIRRLEEIVGMGSSEKTGRKEMAVATDGTPMSITERLQLIRTLNGMPPTQFEELVIALNPPAGILPSNSAAQGTRASELLRWVEGPTGPRLPQLQAILKLILNGEGRPSELPSDAPKPHVAQQTTNQARKLSGSRQGFYERQKAQLEEELAAVESDFAAAPREVDRVRLEKEAERLLEKIEKLDTKLNES